MYICQFVRTILLEISLRFLSIFHRNALYIKFFHNFTLPGVASAAIADFKLVSVLLSVTFTMGAGDDGNKVWFSLTDSTGELTATLKLYCITKNTLYFLLHKFCILNVWIYILIYVSIWELHVETYVSSLRYLSIFFNISKCIFKCKFILHKFVLPDVALACIACF